MVMLGVVSKRLDKQIATLVYLFDPTDVEPGESNPSLDFTSQAPYAGYLRDWLANQLQGHPDNVELLKTSLSPGERGGLGPL